MTLAIPRGNLSDLGSVVLNLTDLCNIHCTYCFEAKNKEKLIDHPQFESVLNTLVEAARETRYDKFSVSFYGGEPLLSFDAIQYTVKTLIDQVGKERFKFRIATNGLLLKGPIKDFLFKYKFGIQVSLDGPPEVIDLHRKDFKGYGTSSRLAHITDHVRDFPEIMARMTVTPEIAPFFSQSLAYLVNIGFNEPSRPIKFDYDYTAIWSLKDLNALETSTREGADFLKEHYFSGGMARVEPLDRVFVSARPPESKCGNGGYCGAGCSQIHVTPQAEFYTCNRLTPSHNPDYKNLVLSKNTLDLGNLESVLSLIHPGIDRKTECATCLARHFCDQTCPARIYSSSGRFDKISDTQCRLIRITHAMGRSVKAGILLGPPEALNTFNKIYTPAIEQTSPSGF